jgi:ankyrin repeat protein
MTSISGISNAAKMPAPCKLLPRPVAFLNQGKFNDSLLEQIELNKKSKELAEEHNISGIVQEEEQAALSNSYSELRKKIQLVLPNIAGKLGVCAILEYSCESYVDPSYDITSQVIDILNQEYLKSHVKTKKPILKQHPQDLLHSAILKNSVKGIQEAVQFGANVNCEKDGKSPLGWAVAYKKYDAVKSLLECGAQSSSALFQESLKINDIKLAILIALNCGADLNAIYSNGYRNGTLLQLATYYKDFESIFLLVKSGVVFFENAIVTVEGYTGFSVMQLIVMLGNGSDEALELIQVLINNGYDVNNIWYEGGNVDHNLYKNEKVLKLFINNGAKPNQIIREKDHAGCNWTPLFKAIDLGSNRTVEILLNAGADINKKANPYPNQPPLCPNGPQTPLSFAINKGQVQIAELLKQYGATL